MGDSEDPMGINDKIEILSTDDDRIKSVGELLSSDSSRTILKLLFNEEMTANQIAQKTEISLPLVMYHLKKMQDCNVVKISQTGKNTKSHDMKYYTVDKFAIVILPSGMSEKARSSKSLFNSFNRIYRFATIGGVSLAAWFSAQFIQQNNRIVLSNARANSGNQLSAPESAFTATGPEMAMKAAPVEETQRGVESIESAPAHDTTEQTVPDVPSPEPQFAENAADQSQYASPPESAMPMDGDTLSYMSPDAPLLGEPISDFYLSIIIALSVGIVGLIIERIIRARRK
jgi:DNA-binding transcriptional ArsR family regulator